MGDYNVSTKKPINWSAKGVERILQNIGNLLNTFRYEVAYDRVLGRDPAISDKPFEQAVPALIAETYELIEEYEPRVNLKDVTITKEDGEIQIEVVVGIG